MSLFLEMLVEAHAVYLTHCAGERQVKAIAAKTDLQPSVVQSWCDALRLPIVPDKPKPPAYQFSPITLVARPI